MERVRHVQSVTAVHGNGPLDDSYFDRAAESARTTQEITQELAKTRRELRSAFGQSRLRDALPEPPDVDQRRNRIVRGEVLRMVVSESGDLMERTRNIRTNARDNVRGLLARQSKTTEADVSRVEEDDLPAEVKTGVSNPWVSRKPPFDWLWAWHNYYASEGHIWTPEHFFDHSTGHVGGRTRYSVADAGEDFWVGPDVCGFYVGDLSSEVGISWTNKTSSKPSAWVKFVCEKSKSSYEVENLAGYSISEADLAAWFTFSFTQKDDPSRFIMKHWADQHTQVPAESDTYASGGATNGQIVWLKVSANTQLTPGSYTAFAGIHVTQFAWMDDVDVAWDLANNWRVGGIYIHAE